MIFDTKALDKQDAAHLLEVLDDKNRPLAVLSKDIIHRQLLKHRSVQVLVFNNEKKLYLQKRDAQKRFFPGRWDISARTHPRIGESTLDAALRVLQDKLQMEVDAPQFVRSLPACAETGFEYVTIYAVTRNTQQIVPNEKDVAEGYHFSREELTCLVKEFRELLTPNLVTLWEAGLLEAP
ncbi:NUDIX domain-containing protein [Pseudodesulfovibrio cashew]|uniref:NUDIX domain-containing protein n=1 Tax=Pseudodesulfovibrio cashew TaxID=2678688 RepID=A0A6I6JJR2_9BACT|nr:NUDIX domain-containing protein [Pseudodesulfovibrio cashew]QGY41208.1 NUDIX domain-containing protein [Pseudodesulfovibrio cashew]